MSVSSEKADEIRARLEAAKNDGMKALDLGLSREIMEMAGIPFNRSKLAKTPDEAVAMAGEVGYPLVMKIVSPQVIHKTEFGGVKVGVNTPEDVRATFDEMVGKVKDKLPDATIEGVLLEEMVKGTEFIVGTTRDPQFGPMIMFGVGGIFVEVYKDVSFRLIPITQGDAGDMLGELKGKAILQGVRGLPKAPPGSMEEILLNVSELIEGNSSIEEMDINPLMLTERGPVAVDARIILKE